MRTNVRIAVALIVMAVSSNIHARNASADEPAAATANKISFAGFPEVGKYREGKRSFETITSDAVRGLVRPRWTRAMTDLGGWPAMFRFNDAIFLVFPHVDGHRGKKFEGTGEYLLYTSRDQGRTWEKQPNPPFVYTPEFVAAQGTLFAYDFTDDKQPTVRTSSDGIAWSEAKNIYKPPFYLWGAMYDPVSKQFWAPPHAIPSKAAHEGRQIHLINSKDGLNWEFVSTVAPFNNASESVLRFEPDRTMVVLVRRKYGSTVTVATAPPPYKEWSMSELPIIAEGEHFFDIGGETFLASRANYQGDDPAVKANPKLFDDRRSYATVYRWTRQRTAEPWAVVDSMGDCSYPFLVETPTEILCAYYSQHEDKVCKVFVCGFDKREFLAGPSQ